MKSIISIILIAMCLSLTHIASAAGLDGPFAELSDVTYTSEACGFTAVFIRRPIEKEVPAKVGQKKRIFCGADNGKIMCCVIYEEFQAPGKSDSERVDEV